MFSFKLKKKPEDKAKTSKEALLRAAAVMGTSIVGASALNFNMMAVKDKKTGKTTTLLPPVGMMMGTMAGAIAAAAAVGAGAALAGMGNLKIKPEVDPFREAMAQQQAEHDAALALEMQMRQQCDASIDAMRNGIGQTITVKGPLRLTAKRSWMAM